MPGRIKLCQNPAKCAYCSGDHPYGECNVKEDGSKKACSNCNVSGHSAIDNEIMCPTKSKYAKSLSD